MTASRERVVVNQKSGQDDVDVDGRGSWSMPGQAAGRKSGRSDEPKLLDHGEETMEEEDALAEPSFKRPRASTLQKCIKEEKDDVMQ